ncbi:MAG: hypothetical protein RSF87_11335 [Cellulosilyticaceae bacterium]
MAIIQNKPNMNYGVWGSNGNIAVPTSEKVDLGWIIEKPPNEVMNWVQNRQDSMLQFINQRGIPTWDSLTEYPLNAYVVRSGTLYRAVSQNIDKDPTLNSAIWNVAFATYTDYSNLYNEVQSIKGVEGYLDLYVSKNNPVMLGEAKGVGYKDSTGVSGLLFINKRPQITNQGIDVAIFEEVDNLTESSKKVVTMDVLLKVLQIYKVGDLYLTTNTTNPNITLGYGTWERYAQGKAIVGVSEQTSDPSWTKGSGATEGYYSNTIVFPYDNWEKEATEIKTSKQGALVVGTGRTEITETLESLTQAIRDKNQVISNIQPSITVNVWRRTA